MTKTTWRINKKTGECEQVIRERKAQPVAPYVQGDEVAPFENPVTGKMETSMSTYRRSLKEHGYFEKGNERLKYELPSFDKRYEAVHEDVLEAKRQIKYGMAKSTSEERELWNKKRR